MSVTRTPLFANTILRVFAGNHHRAETILGDLHAEFTLRVRDDSRFAAVSWYWKEVVAIGCHLARHRAARRLKRGFSALTTLGSGGTPGRLANRGRSFTPKSKPQRMDSVIQDLQYTIRSFARRPAFFLVALITLALGIGSTTTIYSVVEGVLFRALPYPNADRLVQLGALFPGRVRMSPISQLNLRDWQERNTVFESLAAARWVDLDISGDAQPERLAGAGVTSNFFSLLGTVPLIGRSFTDAETRSEQSRLAILSHGLWQRRWGGDPSVVGQSVTLNTERFTVIGVMPADFRGPEAFRLHVTDVWVPLLVSVIGRDYGGRGRGYFTVVGRLKPDVGLLKAQLSMDALTAALAEEYPEANTRRGEIIKTQVVPLYDQTVGTIGQTLTILLAAVGFLLLIACANVANLFLARANDRRRELAVRSTLGASRGRMVRQLLTESVVLAVAGGALGVGVAYAGVSAFTNFAPGDVPRLAEIAVDLPVLGFALALSLVTGILVGLAPAVQSSNIDSNAAIKEGAGHSPSKHTSRLRSGLVVAETALALVLLIGAGLLVNSFVRLINVDPGFEPDGVTIVQMYDGLGYRRSQNAALTLRRELNERVKAIPGVQSVAFSLGLLLSGGRSKGTIPIAVEGREDPMNLGTATWVGPDFFETFGMQMAPGGRDFRPSDINLFSDPDDHANTAVVIVNDAFAREAWPGTDPIGRRVRPPGDASWVTVIGVVNDITRSGLDTPDLPSMYFVDQAGVIGPPLFMVVKSDLDFAALAPTLRQAIRDVDSDLPIGRLSTMNALIADSITAPRFYTLLLSSFGAVALVLAAVGIYGTISYTVGQRTREIGVRMALGADTVNVLSMVVREGLVLSAMGISIGLASALLLSRTLASFLFGVTTTDPTTFIVASLILLSVAVVACCFPARRAARLDPAITLRSE